MENPQFNSLRIISGLYKLIGWLVTLLGGWSIIFAFKAVSIAKGGILLLLPLPVTILIVGIGLIATGEAIMVFLAIEINTRKP